VSPSGLCVFGCGWNFGACVYWFGCDEMSYEDVVSCDDGVGFVVYICIAATIPYIICCLRLLYHLWSDCGTGHGVGGCGCWCDCCFYSMRFASASYIVGTIITMIWFIISVFNITVRWGVARHG